MMQEENNIPRPIVVTFLLIGSFFVSIIFAQIFVLIFFPASLTNLEDLSGTKILLLLSEFSMILLPVYYFYKKRYSIPFIFRWRMIDEKIILWSVVLGISLSLIGDELDRIINVFITPPEYLQDLSTILKISSFEDFIILFFGTVIIASIVEESIFRGMLQLTLEKYKDVTKAVIYTSLVWTFIHGIMHWALQIFLIGVVLGYLTWRTRSILPAVICHSINNALALWQNNSDEEILETLYLWKGHVSPLILIPAIFATYYGLNYINLFYRVENSSDSDSTGSDVGNSE